MTNQSAIDKNYPEYFISFANFGFPVEPGLTLASDSELNRPTNKSAVPEAKSMLGILLNQIIETQTVPDSAELRYFTVIAEQEAPKFSVRNGQLIKQWRIAGEKEFEAYEKEKRELGDGGQM